MALQKVTLPTRELLYTDRILFALDTANMNVTTDQKFRKLYDNIGDFRITRIFSAGHSIALSTAVGGIYPTTGKGGTPIVPASQGYASPDDLALAFKDILTGAATPYLSLSTSQGAAATARIFIMGVPIS